MSHKHESALSTLLLILICSLTYGLFLTQWGFYWDDYASVFVYQVHGSGIFEDWFGGQARPIGGILSGAIWDAGGINPLVWHVLNFGLYTLAVILFWRILRLLWREHPAWTTLVALLFAVYPSYHLRPIGISFNLILGLVIALLSFWLSLMAVQRKNHLLAWLAALLIPVHVLIYEQNLGYEALRPLAMWMLVGFSWQALRRVVLPLWIPSVIASAGTLIYRFVIFEPDETYGSYNQLSLSLDSIILAVKRSVAEPFEMLIVDWWRVPARVFLEHDIDLDRPALLSVIGLGLVLAYVWRFQNDVPLRIRYPVVGIGILLAMMGGLLLLVHLVGREVTEGFNSRWALTPSPLAALVLGIVVTRLVKTPAFAHLILAIGVLVGMLSQMGIGQIYADDWELRRELGWQMHWRAPDIEPDTLIVILFGEHTLAFDREITDYEVATHANFYYFGERYPWIGGGDWQSMLALLASDAPRQGRWGTGIRASESIFRDWQFDWENTLIFAYDGGCLLTATPQLSTAARPIPSLQALQFLHNPAVIRDTPLSDATPPDAIVAPEPLHGWCFYYQQIQWALQFGQVEQAAELAAQARRLGFAPVHSIEWLPVIEAFNRTGQESEAEKLLASIALDNANAHQYACETLKNSDAPANQLGRIPGCAP